MKTNLGLIQGGAVCLFVVFSLSLVFMHLFGRLSLFILFNEVNKLRALSHWSNNVKVLRVRKIVGDVALSLFRAFFVVVDWVCIVLVGLAWSLVVECALAEVNNPILSSFKSRFESLGRWSYRFGFDRDRYVLRAIQILLENLVLLLAILNQSLCVTCLAHSLALRRLYLLSLFVNSACPLFIHWWLRAVTRVCHYFWCFVLFMVTRGDALWSVFMGLTVDWIFLLVVQRIATLTLGLNFYRNSLLGRFYLNFWFWDVNCYILHFLMVCLNVVEVRSWRGRLTLLSVNLSICLRYLLNWLYFLLIYCLGSDLLLQVLLVGNLFFILLSFQFHLSGKSASIWVLALQIAWHNCSWMDSRLLELRTISIGAPTCVDCQPYLLRSKVFRVVLCNISYALSPFSQEPLKKQVVYGRGRVVTITDHVLPSSLFFYLFDLANLPYHLLIDWDGVFANINASVLLHA